MKNIPAFLLAAALLLCLCGCGASSPADTAHVDWEATFYSPEELADYAAKNMEEPIPLFEIAADEARWQLWKITLHGSHIYYWFAPADLSAEREDLCPDETDVFSVGWNFTGSGEAGLAHSVENLGLSPVPGHEGFWSYSDDGEETYNDEKAHRMLFWAQDDCYFIAAVPAPCFEETLERIASLTAPLVRRMK